MNMYINQKQYNIVFYYELLTRNFNKLINNSRLNTTHHILKVRP